MQTEVVAAIITGVATVAAAVVTVVLSRKKASDSDSLSSSAEARRKRSHTFDVFVSTPLAALATDQDVAAAHEQFAPVVALLETELGFSVYWAGRNIRKKADFEAADLSARSDVEALVESKYFLLLYPDRLASSVLFEAGIALRACLTSIYAVRDVADLPFLMTQASQAFSNVRTYAGPIPSSLCALLRKHGKSFFDPRYADA